MLGLTWKTQNIKVKMKMRQPLKKNPNKKEKEKEIMKMLTKTMAIHELSAKKFFEVILKKNGNLAFLNTSNFGSNYGG